MNGPLSARSGPSSDLSIIGIIIVTDLAALASGLLGQPLLGVAALAAGPALAWILLRRTTRRPETGRALDGWRTFRRELQRSRRASRPLTLVRYPAGAGAADAGHRVAVLGRALRRIDHVWSQGSDLYAMLPETEQVPAVGALQRAAELSGLDVGSPVVATFPDDGLTSSALLDVLRGRGRVASAGLRPSADASAPVMTGLGAVAVAPTPTGVPVVASTPSRVDHPVAVPVFSTRSTTSGLPIAAAVAFADEDDMANGVAEALAT